MNGSRIGSRTTEAVARTSVIIQDLLRKSKPVLVKVSVTVGEMMIVALVVYFGIVLINN